MTKADLIESLSDRLGLVKIDAERVVDGVLDAIVEALKQGDPVNISGFGKFAVSTRAARTGRNPKTGEAIEISAARSAKFKLGKQLKESLNGAGAASPGGVTTPD
jgi:DNA-binding protein HU-beta